MLLSRHYCQAALLDSFSYVLALTHTPDVACPSRKLSAAYRNAHSATMLTAADRHQLSTQSYNALFVTGMSGAAVAEANQSIFPAADSCRCANSCLHRLKNILCSVFFTDLKCRIVAAPAAKTCYLQQPHYPNRNLQYCAGFYKCCLLLQLCVCVPV